jgi:RHS repeat-associated protein
MDKLSYSYEMFTHNQKKNTNKLLSVADAENTYTLAGYEDIKPGQSYASNTLLGNNYSYDAIGNLVQDQQEEIEQISWNVYGKIAEITRTGASTKAGLAFLYNPSGHRVCKIVKPAGAAPEAWHYTYYMLDAQGNTLSTYSLLGNAIQQERVLLYGSSRLGELSTLPSQLGTCNIAISDEDLVNNRAASISALLNNVFANSNNASFTQQAIDFWTVRWDEYFANQTNLMATEVNTISTHQFMWNAWVNWMCGMRCYTNLDASVFTIWQNEWTSRLNPFTSQEIACSKEMCPEVYENLLPLWHLNEQNQQVALNNNGFISNCNMQLSYVKGARHYELSNHLGNVLSVVSDRKIEVDESYTYQTSGGYIYQNGTYTADPYGNYTQNSVADGLIDGYVAEVISATDYYAFGSPMPGRSFQSSEYRFGFNGQERDDEVAGVGNINTAEFWEYDARLGRRWNLDPVTKPNEGPYSCFANNPIWLTDPNGNDTLKIIGANNSQWNIFYGTGTAVQSYNLCDYNVNKDIGKKSFDIGVMPDAIGIDIQGAANLGCFDGNGGVNILWHTRGEKSENKWIPEIHIYTGFGLSVSSSYLENSITGQASVSLMWAYAETKDFATGKMVPAKDTWVANGFNWTGNFYYLSGSMSFAGWGISGSKFTSLKPGTNLQLNESIWSGYSIGVSRSAGGASGSLNLSRIKDIFKNASIKNSSINTGGQYYWMIYGNGSDFIPSSNEDVSGWNIFNPIDPTDNK